MATKSISLEFVFITDTGSSEKITLKSIKEDLDPSKISDFVNDAIRNKYFVPSKGTSIVDIQSVKTITTTIEDVL